MIARLKTCLTNPKRIGEYKNDKAWMSLLYMLLLSALVIIPSFIMVAKSDGVKESTVYAIRRMLVENKEEMPKGGIYNGVLEIEKKADDEITGFFVGDIAIIFGDTEVSSLAFAAKGCLYMARLEEKTIDLYYLSSKFDSFTYEEIGLKNLDFDFISTNDNEGFNQLEKAYVKIVNDTENFWKPWQVIFDWLSIFLGIVVIALLYGVISKMIRKMPYKQSFNIALYSLSIAMIFIVFGNLYNLYFLSILGGIVSLFYLVLALRNVDTTIEEE